VIPPCARPTECKWLESAAHIQHNPSVLTATDGLPSVSPHPITGDTRRMNANDWNEAALAKYIVTNPVLQAEIQDLSPEEQKNQTLWAFEDEAESQGIETWELALQFIADSPEQLKEMRLAAHQQAAEALGMDWDEYRQLNDLDD
jgi:hypothetical protein